MEWYSDLINLLTALLTFGSGLAAICGFLKSQKHNPTQGIGVTGLRYMLQFSQPWVRYYHFEEQRFALSITPGEVLGATTLLALFEAGVARAAQALEGTSPEPIQVSTPGGDAIHGVGCGGYT